jgi:hypothetical protein
MDDFGWMAKLDFIAYGDLLGCCDLSGCHGRLRINCMYSMKPLHSTNQHSNIILSPIVIIEYWSPFILNEFSHII